MILTAIVAVILGLGRAAIAGLHSYFDKPVGGEWLVFVFLDVAAVLMTLPLLLSALLPRYALAATGAVLVLTALVTAWELPLMARLVPAGVGGASTWIFVFINAFQAGWVLCVIGLMRLGGYRLSSGQA
jgi:hypothetical protein